MDFTLTTYKTLLKSLQAAGYKFLTFEKYVQDSKDMSFGFGVSGSGLKESTSDKVGTSPPVGGFRESEEKMKRGTENSKQETENSIPETGNEKRETRDRKLKTINVKPEAIVILRHDVDLKAGNSLKTAIIENELGISSTYYFRVVKQSNKPEIIEKIKNLGHEIGYHYEDLSVCKGNYESAIKGFEKNLNHFRQFYPVKTICMHGSPLSKYDNRKLWEKYNYRDFGIIGEPYFDVDFSGVLYLTDTGRRWDGEKVSVRDKVQGSKFNVKGSKEEITSNEVRTSPHSGGFKGSNPSVRQLAGSSPFQPSEALAKEAREQMKQNQKQETENGKQETENKKQETGNVLKTTFDIIDASQNNLLPHKIMITTHPQRWTNNPLSWTKELVFQNVKNIVKKMIVKLGK